MDSFCLSSFEFFWHAPKDNFIYARVTFRPFKVIDFGANRKRVCDFLLVRHSNLGPILHRFGDIACFCAHDPTTISYQIAHVGINQSRSFKLSGREIIFEVFQPG